MTEDGKSVQLALTAGLSPGAKLRENRCFALTPIGVEFAGELTFEQWLDAMKALKMWDDAGKVWLADFVMKGREAFGQEKVQEVMSQLEFALMDADKALAIATLPRGLRHEKLTSEHYWVLATSDLVAADQTKWAQLTLDHSLSPRTLKESIAAGKVVTTNTSGGSKGGVPTVHAFRQTFDRWFTTVQSNEPVIGWDVDRKRALWAELEAPTLLGLQIARELGVSLESGVKA